jgi:hypothetical protein
VCAQPQSRFAKGGLTTDRGWARGNPNDETRNQNEARAAFAETRMTKSEIRMKPESPVSTFWFRHSGPPRRIIDLILVSGFVILVSVHRNAFPL